VQIVVNTRLLLDNKQEGIGWFTQRVLERICQNNKDIHFVFLFDRKFDERFVFSDNITPLVISPPTRHPFLWYYWLQYGVKPILRRMQPDLFFSPDGFLPLGASCKMLPVIHDINFLHYPQFLKPLTARYYNHFFPKFAQEAARILTVSEFSKQEIISNYHVAQDKVDVVYNGINPHFRPLSAEERRQAQKKYAQGHPYFIYTGSIHPRKNIKRLVQAFILFKEKEPNPMKMVIAGPNFWGSQEIMELIDRSSHKGDVLFTGRLNEQDLAEAMGGATALTFVPLYEGFGIPLIEAMTAGVPILTSQVSSLPEVADKAAIYCHPEDVNAISEGLHKLMDERVTLPLIKAGMERVHHFSWDRTADLVWKGIEKVVQ